MELSRELEGEAVVYVPRVGAPEPRLILPGSGIVGKPRSGTDRVLVYYEGAKGRPIGMERLADRVFYAYWRLLSHAETVAFAALPHQALEAVGTWDHVSGLITLFGEDSERKVAEWLAVPVLEQDELQSQWRHR